MRRERTRARRGLSAVLACCWACAVLAAAPASLQEQLRNLATQRGFTVEGLGRLGEAPPGNADGTPLEQLKHLLQGYNYVVTQSRPGVIQRVRIISARGEGGKKGSADSAYVQTRRVRAHHVVEAALVGPNSVTRTLPLMVDTGASTLVLPSSLIGELGFTAADLQSGNSQTASGTVPVRIGRLRSVRVGSVAAENVEVSFIDDRQLEGNKLLGMSFLQRFRMTIDDANNELVLLAK